MASSLVTFKLPDDLLKELKIQAEAGNLSSYHLLAKQILIGALRKEAGVKGETAATTTAATSATLLQIRVELQTLRADVQHLSTTLSLLVSQMDALINFTALTAQLLLINCADSSPTDAATAVSELLTASFGDSQNGHLG